MRVSPVEARSTRRWAPCLAVMSLLILSLGLAGCGNKGPLKLPDSATAATRAR